MAWTYHDFEEQATDTLRLARLRQHLTEVQSAAFDDGSINADAYGRTRNRDQYLQMLRARLKDLEESARSTAGTGRGVSYAKFARPR